MRPHFEDIQAHYDLSDDFFALFQDPSRTYSCAYFDPADLSLEQAQTAKIDLNLDKLDLKPGMTLLDIGCGWGATMKRAMEKYDVNVIGLTLSKNQQAYTAETARPGRFPAQPRRAAARLGGVQQPRRPHRVDRGVRALRFRPLPRLLRELCLHHAGRRADDDPEHHGLPPLRHGRARHSDHVRALAVRQVHPHRDLPRRSDSDGEDDAGTRREGRFVVPEVLSLRSHYIRTLSIWGDALEANRDEAVEIQSEEVYDRYQRYLRGCQALFTDEYCDVTSSPYRSLPSSVTRCTATTSWPGVPRRIDDGSRRRRRQCRRSSVPGTRSRHSRRSSGRRSR